MSQGTVPYPGYIIEVGEIAAGIALTERGGFAFVASDRRFTALERHKFKTLGKIVEAACEIIAPPPKRRHGLTSSRPRQRAAAQAA